MKLLAPALFSAALATTASAEDSSACANVASVLDEVIAEWPDLTGGTRTKPRMAVVSIGGAAGLALAYATDDGWSEDELAPIIALRDTREPDANGETLSRDDAPGVILTHAIALADLLAEKCPDTPRGNIDELHTPEQ